MVARSADCGDGRGALPAARADVGQQRGISRGCGRPVTTVGVEPRGPCLGEASPAQSGVSTAWTPPSPWHASSECLQQLLAFGRTAIRLQSCQPHVLNADVGVFKEVGLKTGSAEFLDAHVPAVQQ
jgi:hypothetical protein